MRLANPYPIPATAAVTSKTSINFSPIESPSTVIQMLDRLRVARSFRIAALAWRGVGAGNQAGTERSCRKGRPIVALALESCEKVGGCIKIHFRLSFCGDYPDERGFVSEDLRGRPFSAHTHF